MLIGVISDTHINESGRRIIPPRVFSAFKDVEFILHAGDLTARRVLTELEAIAPTFAVRGNNDSSELGLETSRRFEWEGRVIGLVHGDRFARGQASSPALPYAGNTHASANALSHFEHDGDVDCVIFGHSHRPLCVEHTLDSGAKVLLLNPGSPTDRRFGPRYGIALLHIEKTGVRAEMIQW